MKVFAFALSILALGSIGCSKSSDSGSGSGSSPSTNYAVGGKLTSLSTSSVSMKNGVATMAVKTITHVMAVSPQTSNPEKFVGTVNADGTFTLGIKTGAPYVFVFVDDTKVGDDMIVGIFNPGSVATGLDTLVPSEDATAVSLGDVTVNGTSQVATMSTTFADFLSALGIDSTTATTIGAVDDLSLRGANPDIDSNGEIDALENNKQIWLDFHVRSMMNCTTHCTGGRMSFDGINGSYLTDTTAFVLEPAGTSAYAVYMDTFDSTPLTTYVPTSGVSTSPAGGAAWAATDMPGGGTADIDSPATFSGIGFDVYNQWGPDFALGTGGIELPGYDHPVKMVWTMGSKSLTFSHVRTRAKAGLFNLVPDFKVNLGAGGVISSIDYRWMKWTGSAWAAASTDEVQLLVAEGTPGLGFSTVKSGGVEEGVNVEIPTNAASGTIAWNSTTVSKTSGVTTAVEALKLDDFCGGSSSYDDKLGLRIFAYAFSPTAGGGKTVCP